MGLFTKIEWKNRRGKFGPIKWSRKGPKLISVYADLWLWKGKLYPRKRSR